MLRKLLRMTLLLALALSLGLFALPQAAQAQDEAAHIRFAAYFYHMRVAVDDATVHSSLRYPFVSRYSPLEPGTHQLVVAPADPDSDKQSVEQELDLAAGHHYLVVAWGSWDDDDAPSLLVIDETEALAGFDPAGNLVIALLLLSGAPPVDIVIDGDVVSEGLAHGEAAFLEMPLAEFDALVRVAGSPDAVLYEEEFIGISQSSGVAAILGSGPDDFFLFLSNESEQTIAGYLAELAAYDGGGFSTVQTALELTGLDAVLAGDGPFTLFAPADWVFDELPDDMLTALLTDPDGLADVLRYHVVAESIPPYELVGQESLTTLHGGTLTLAFPGDDWWNINDDAPIYNHIYLGNGVLYEIGGVLLPPAE